MIRDRLAAVAKRVGRRLFLPEERASVRTRGDLARHDGKHVDEEKLPPIQDGDGDTPGPNHKTDIGRTWASAQLAGGIGVVAVDVRTPSEFLAGHLPGALLLPRAVLAGALDRLPPPDPATFVVVYDATGQEGSAAAAELLRQRGWPRARRLVGGFAEWVEEGEEVVNETRPDRRFALGDTVTLPDGRSGTVWTVSREGNRDVGVLVGDGGATVREEDLR